MSFYLNLIAALVIAGSGAAAETGPLVHVERNIVYREISGDRIRLDAYRALETTGTRPVVLMFHGGGWRGGSKEFHKEKGEWLARAGYVVFSANYRLSPRHKWPAVVNDCRAALTWVRLHARDFHGDPTRIALSGESAGGHLAMLVGLLDASSTAPMAGAPVEPVRSVINIFGPPDLTGPYDAPEINQLLHDLLGSGEEEFEIASRLASPITYLGGPAPAFLHIQGKKDHLVSWEMVSEFHEDLQADGADSTLLLFDNVGHGWAPDSPEDVEAKETMLEFLGRTLLD